MEAAELRMRFTSTGAAAVKSDIHSVDSSIDSLGNSANAAKGKLGGMFQVAGGIIGAQIVGHMAGWVGGMLSVNAQAESMIQSLTVIKGSAEEAKQIWADTIEFAKVTPFSTSDLAQAVVLLEGAGIKSKEWIEAIGDTAAVTQHTVNQVTQAVLDANTGQFERLKELNIDAQIEGDKLVFLYHKNGQEIRETVDKNNTAVVTSTLNSIMNSMYGGAMEAQSKTFIGQWSTLKDNVSMQIAAMGAGIFEFAKGSLGFFNDIFANGFVTTVRGTFGDGVADFITGVGDMVGALNDAWGSGTRVNDLIAKFPAPLQSVGHFFLLAADAAGFLYRQLRDEGLGGALRALPDVLGQVWDGLRRVGEQLFHITLDFVVDIGGDLLALRDDAAQWIKEALFWTAGKTIQLGLLLIDTTIELKDSQTTSDSFAAKTGNALVAGLGRLTSLGGDVAGAIVDQITSLDWASWITIDAFTSGESFGAAVHDAIVGAVSAGLTLITEADLDASSIIEGIGGAVVAAAAAAPAATIAVSTALAAFFAGAITGLIFGDDVDFGSVIDKISAGVVDAINAASDWATDIASAFVSGTWSAFANADYSGIGSAIATGIWNAAKDLVPNLPFGSLLPSSWGGTANDAFPPAYVPSRGGGAGDGLQAFVSPSVLRGLSGSGLRAHGVGATQINNYHLQGSIVGADIQRFIDDRVTTRTASAVDRRIVRSRIAESV